MRTSPRGLTRSSAGGLLSDAYAEALRRLRVRRRHVLPGDDRDLARLSLHRLAALPSAAHNLQLGSYWSAQAQEEIFGPDGHFVASMSWAPDNAEVARVDGGYRVRATWHYASGVPYATHHMGLLPLPESDRGSPPATVMVVIPREKFTMLDDWGNLIGLKGSGSHSLVVEGLSFRASRRPVRPLPGRRGRTPQAIDCMGIALALGSSSALRSARSTASRSGTHRRPWTSTSADPHSPHDRRRGAASRSFEDRRLPALLRARAVVHRRRRVDPLRTGEL